MTYTLTRATLYDALQRGASVPADGTYYLIPGWIKWAPGEPHQRTWTVDPIVEHEGYEVALRPAVGDWWADTMHYADGMRIGVWTDSAGATYIDRTVHVNGSLSDAMAIAAQFNQTAIWDWQTRRALYVADYQRSVTEGI
jgi:hypothetical protein